MEKVTKFGVLAFALLGLVFMIWTLSVGDAAILADTGKQDLIVGNYLLVSYLLLAIAAGSAIVFSFINIAKNPAAFKRAMIGIGAVVVIFLIGYFMADGSDYVNYTSADYEVTESASKWSGAGLNTFYIMVFVAIGSVLYAEFSKAFK